MRKLVLMAVFAVAMLATTTAKADGVTTFDPLGTQLYATGGHVIAYFVGGDAGFNSTASLYFPSYSGEIFPNHATAYGASVDLGDFAAGTALTFRLHVYNTGNNWFTGPAAGNADGIVHAKTGAWVGTTIPNGTYVGFEDLYGGGDFDYNDHQFVFTNVSNPSNPVPEPGTLALLGFGIAGIVARRRS